MRILAIYLLCTKLFRQIYFSIDQMKVCVDDQTKERERERVSALFTIYWYDYRKLDARSRFSISFEVQIHQFSKSFRLVWLRSVIIDSYSMFVYGGVLRLSSL